MVMEIIRHVEKFQRPLDFVHWTWR